MGAAPSSFNSLLESKRKHGRMEELQELILEYLASEDYCADPYKHFEEIASYGYETLEEFISDIPSSSLTSQIIDEQLETQAIAKVGMRYVVSNEPWRRGTLVKPISILPNGNLATLRMDETFYWTFFLILKSINLFFYVFFPLRLIVNKIFGPNMLTDSKRSGENQLCSINFDHLVPEKDYLLTCLLRNERIIRNVSFLLPPVEMIEAEPYPITTDDESFSEDSENYEEHGRLEAPLLQLKEAEKVEHHEEEKEDEKWVGLSVKTEETNSNGNLPTVEKAPILQKEESFEKSGPVGTHTGIEGAHNSCYLDSLLFSMFYTTTVFDFLLEPKPTDTEFMKETRKILKESVVTPLREIYYCDYESVMNLRVHLSVKNEDLMGAFMDAEQVLYLLCEDVLAETQFIQYASVDDDGWGDFMHLMSIDASDPSEVINVQRNLETSFAVNGDIKMSSVPSPAFILGMPRSNRELIHYTAVIPNTTISIENLLESAPCHICGNEADWELQPFPGDRESKIVQAICTTCIAFEDNESGVPRRIVSRSEMQLCSVICIRGAHFTAFVRNSGGNGEEENAWYYFDSMAGGHPEVKVVPKLEEWLEEVGNEPESFLTRRKIPALVKRCFTDGHLSIYEPILYKKSQLSRRD